MLPRVRRQLWILELIWMSMMMHLTISCMTLLICLNMHQAPMTMEPIMQVHQAQTTDNPKPCLAIQPPHTLNQAAMASLKAMEEAVSNHLNRATTTLPSLNNNNNRAKRVKAITTNHNPVNNKVATIIMVKARARAIASHNNTNRAAVKILL